ncbi:MAG: hypothetical protein JXR51_07570 [Bacteroidales bacterium]|nr:hypothetical protein [Bacteroidales bacterium]MBN2757022.1 hypothetical protein [Bacteroidales bacterium]
MEKFGLKAEEQKKNENSKLQNFINGSKLELLNHYQMNKIKGGEGEEGDTDANQTWK